MNPFSFFCLKKGNVHAIPSLHYNMETAALVRQTFKQLQPDCVAVELPETMQKTFLHAASRLPDISVIIANNSVADPKDLPLYYMCEPCDAAFEGLRSALEAQIPAYCIDLDINYYPNVNDLVPDPYAIQRIGLKKYYESFTEATKIHGEVKFPVDIQREMYMARRLKELSFSYERILFISGMSHTQNVLNLIDRTSFPEIKHVKREQVELCTVTANSSRQVLAEYGWISQSYEELRDSPFFPPDRQRLIYSLFKKAGVNYMITTGNAFPGYHLRNLMKFARNYAITTHRLMPDLFQIISIAKGCVDHNFAYEVWVLATGYPYLKNIDALPELDLTIEELWGNSKSIKFHLRQNSRKELNFHPRRHEKSKMKFQPPGIYSICSYPPEDTIVETFGNFLKKKGKQILSDEAVRTRPFSDSLEEGVDVRETLRHWHEKQLYVKVKGQPPGDVGSVVVIFDEDNAEDNGPYSEKYPWLTTWMGEHEQESDMAFYATPITSNVVGPGISRCEYGGFMMSYPPRRMQDIWGDPDYSACRTKSEVLLLAAIDYSLQPAVVYVASKPPRSALKSFAQRFGKKIIYIPIGQLSPITLNKLRAFHVLDSHEKRSVADEYIF